MRSWIWSLLFLVGCGDPVENRPAAAPSDPSRIVRENRGILDRIPDLEDRADLAVTGQLGCWGFSETTLVTSRGIRTSSAVSDGRRVFGLTIRTAELIDLLKARSRFNRTGQGPMAGQKSALCFVIFDALSHAADPDSIAVIGELLHDPVEVISSFAAITLITIGIEADDLRPSICNLKFPRKAISGAGARGVATPEWLPSSAIQD